MKVEGKFPVGIAVTLALQAAAGLWWAATTNSKLEQCMVLSERNAVEIDGLNDLSERIAIVERDTQHTREGVARIEGKLDQLLAGGAQ